MDGHTFNDSILPPVPPSDGPEKTTPEAEAKDTGSTCHQPSEEGQWFPPEIPEQDPVINNSGWLTRAFSFKGRITRAEFVLSHAGVLLLGFIVDFFPRIASLFSEEAALSVEKFVGFSSLFVFCWFYTAQAVKRAHDTGRTGWYCLIPFYNTYLLFARPQQTPNRYGTPGTVRTTTAEDCKRCRDTRNKGFFCALSWLVFSPLYLWLSWKWQLQKPVKRTFIFLLSPLVMATAGLISTTNQQATEKQEEIADIRSSLSHKSLKIKLHIEDIEKTGKGRFTLTLSHPLTESDIRTLEESTRSLGSWSKKAQQSAEEDYGYYMEDYGSQMPDTTSTSQTQPPTYLFNKAIQLPHKKQAVHIQLEVTPGKRTANLTMHRRAAAEEG